MNGLKKQVWPPRIVRCSYGWSSGGYFGLAEAPN